MAVNDLYIQQGEEINIKLPVAPENYNVESNQENIEADLYKFGRVVTFTRPGLRVISLDSFFTDKDYSFRRDITMGALQCVEAIENLKKTEDSFQVIITNTGIGTDTEFLGVVDQFSYVTTGSGDINFSLVIKENKKVR